jgi:Fe-S cluster assembly protein SufD
MNKPEKAIPAVLANRLGNWIDSGHAGPEWLLDQRRAALDVLLRNGLPTRKTEDWKYTDTSMITGREWNYPPLNPDCLATVQQHHPGMLHSDDLNIVLVNGIYCPALSNTDREDTIEVVSLRSPLAESLLEAALAQPDTPMEQPFSTLNRAGWRDGVALTIAPGKRPPARIHLLLLHEGDTKNALITPRIVLSAGAGSDTTVAITHASCSPESCLSVPAIDLEIADNARLRLYQTQSLNTVSFHVGTLRITIGRDCLLQSLEAAFGGALARQNLTVAFNGPGSEAALSGIYTLNGDRLCDFHTAIIHRLPNCRSRQVYKGILDERATAVFNGAVQVAPHASGTDGYQLNRTLLRSPQARVFTKPELRIDNDDVRCTHGATVGQLDPRQLFYLQSRGIGLQQARDILARGFVEDLLFAVDSPRQREALDRCLDRFFKGKS